MTKIAVIADVHGNLPALEAVVRHARARNAAGMILNLGDLTGYGPFPDEVVNWSRSPQVISVLGDYDAKVISKKQRKSAWQQVKTEHKREMFAWTHRALSKRARQYLASLPASTTVEIEGVRILLTHASPGGSGEYLGPDTPAERWDELAETVLVPVMLFGHTHQAYSLQAEGTLFVNPGTVGRPDDGDPRASYAILTVEDGQVEVEHFRVPYDIMAAVRGLRQAGLPEVFSQVVRRGLNYDDALAAWDGEGAVPELEPSGKVCLLTDFGLKDEFVGVMKGVIASIAPQTQVIDISHQVRPQDVAEGAHFLAQAVPYFPPGTVYVAVVDPGVGTHRRGLAARIGDHFFVAPDNGLLTLVLETAWAEQMPVRLVSLEDPHYWLPQVSSTFHGRDIFSPVGAHLANGLPLSNLGPAIDDPILLELAHPWPTTEGWEAEVARVDGFGNLCTNLRGDALPADAERIVVRIGRESIHGLTQAFGDSQPGTLIAMVDSSGFVAVAEVNGNAARRLGVGVGEKVLVQTQADKPLH